jgi:dihydrofolate synthase/folylpolyglutamate synthase
MKKIFWPKYELDGNLPRYGLERMRLFLDAFNKSEKNIPPIFHVTGTNGKGSVTAFLKYILESNGYLVHRFTSPHIVDWNERIEVSSSIITDVYAETVASECKNFADSNELQLSYFEGIFAIAINAFSKNPAVACVFEVGMGGRLDATNVFNSSLVSIITKISLDHTKILGETNELIAIEKAGIMKQNGVTIVNKNDPEVVAIFDRIGKERNNKVFVCDRDWSTQKIENGFIFEGFGKKIVLPLPSLWGEHQIDNAGGTIAALLAQNQIKVTDDSIKKGLLNTKWIGRLQDLTDTKLKQFIPQNAQLIIDGAHNDSGAETLKKWILNENKQNKKYNILITAMLQRKNANLFIKNLDKCFDMVITTKMNNEDKSRTPDDYKNEFLKFNWDNVVSINTNFIDALLFLKKRFDNDDKKIRIVMSGSLYFMGEILEFERKLNGIKH